MLERYLQYIKELALKDDRAHPLPYKLWCLSASDEKLKASTRKMMHKLIDYTMLEKNRVELTTDEYTYGYIMHRPCEKLDNYKENVIEHFAFTAQQLAILQEFEHHARYFYKNAINETFDIGCNTTYLAIPYVPGYREIADNCKCRYCCMRERKQNDF